MNPLQPGECIHLMHCDEPTTTQDDTGDEVVTFVQAFNWWTKIEPLTGRERTVSNQPIAEGTTRIRGLWSPWAARINAKWRLRYRDTIYNIAGPPAEVDMGRREIEIIATSGVNVG